MAEQVQCPNCGGYKVKVETIIVDRSSGKRVAETGCAGWALILFLLIGALGYIFIGEGRGGPTPVTVLLGTVVILFAILMMRLAVRGNAEARRTDKIEKYNCECALCGYQWSRREDEPIPSATVRPDLIAKGEQRLEEESKRREEEIRRAMDMKWLDEHRK